MIDLPVNLNRRVTVHEQDPATYLAHSQHVAPENRFTIHTDLTVTTSRIRPAQFPDTKQESRKSARKQRKSSAEWHILPSSTARQYIGPRHEKLVLTSDDTVRI